MISGPPLPTRTRVNSLTRYRNFPSLRSPAAAARAAIGCASKSVNRPPFIVFIANSAESPSRNSTSTLPFTVLNDDGCLGLAVKVTLTGPFTVWARPEPPTPFMSISPLTLVTSKSPWVPLTITSPPLIAHRRIRASRGTRIVKSNRTL